MTEQPPAIVNLSSLPIPEPEVFELLGIMPEPILLLATSYGREWPFHSFVDRLPPGIGECRASSTAAQNAAGPYRVILNPSLSSSNRHHCFLRSSSPAYVVPPCWARW